METVSSLEADTLDAVCFRYYGTNSMLEAVIAANPALAKLPAVLPENTEINMPEQKQTTNITRLWT
jgi:phage tail protein X